MSQYTLGIDIGSTTVKAALLDSSELLVFSAYERHYADIQGTLTSILSRIYEKRDFDTCFFTF